MCGISAFFAPRPERTLAAQVGRCLDLAAHRGPDGRGLIAGRGSEVLEAGEDGAADWALGHVRLAILDLSPAGAQPMASPDRLLWLSFNGEIYNYLELRRELQGLGHVFNSASDTEVILAAYAQWGADCFGRLAGMFALVMVDLKVRRVVIARDRLGIKPLYVWTSSRGAALVSEPKQLYAFEGFNPRANRRQVMDFLVDGVLGHEPDQCFFSGVHPLPPGHWLAWPLGQMPILDAAQRYWAPERRARPMTWKQAVEAVGATFNAVLAQHLRSDVPVGSCLSGGVDSSAVVGAAGRMLGGPVHTFSSCFDDAACNEQPYIDAVNRHLPTVPHKVFPDEDGVLADLDDLVYHQDEPMASFSPHAQWCVMRQARQSAVPVLLDGQGGDEALMGYRKYAWFRLRELLARGCVGQAAQHAGQLLAHGDRGVMRLSLGQRYLPSWARREVDLLGGMLRPEWRGARRRVWAERMAGVRAMHEHQWADFIWWSLPVLLRYEDRNSMAHAVEGRVPLVDHRFIELCLSLPEEFIFRRGRTKRLLVDALPGDLPAEVIARRDKMGFDVPQAAWLRGRLGQALAERMRRSERLDQIIDAGAATDAMQRLQRGDKRVDVGLMVRLASLAMWLDRFQVDVPASGRA